MTTFEVIVSEKTVTMTPAEAEDRLDRAIAVTDIEPRDDDLVGALSVWGIDCQYEWTVESAEDKGTTVRETVAVNTIGFLAPAAMVIATALLCLAALSIASDTTPFASSQGIPKYASWQAYAIFGVGLLLALISFAYIIRLEHLPTPINEAFSSDVVSEHRERMITGLAVVCFGIWSPLVIPGLLLTFSGWSLYAGDRPVIMATATLCLSCIALPVIGYCYVAQAEHILRLSDDLTLRFEPNDPEPVPYRILEAQYGNIPLSTLESRIEKAASDVGINVDPKLSEEGDEFEVITGKRDWHGIEATYEWQIVAEGKLGNRKYAVRETTLLDQDFPLVIYITALIGAIIIVLTRFEHLITPITGGYVFVASTTALSLTLAMGAGVLLLYIPGLVFPHGVNTSDRNVRIESQQFPVEYYVIAISVPMFVGFHWPDYLTDVVPAAMVVALLIVGTVSFLTYHQYAGRLEGLPTPFDLSPPITGYLSSITLLIAVPVVILVAGPEEIPMFLYAIFAVIAVILAGWVIKSTRTSLEVTTALFESRVVESSNHLLIRWAAYVFAALTSILAVGAPLAVAAAVISMDWNSSIQFVLAGAFLTTAAVPTAGVAYQVGSRAAHLRREFRESHRVDPIEYGLSEYRIDAELRIYDGPPGGAKGLSLGWRDVVFFSTGDAAVLDDDELAALLAHEDAHASVYNDGLISVYAPLLAGITATGQNVLFAVLEFDKRELRADCHAAEIVSPGAIVNAIETIREEIVTQQVDGGKHSTAIGFTSFTPPSDNLTWADKTFGLFYGPYTMTRAHPSVDERRANIERFAEEDSSNGKIG